MDGWSEVANRLAEPAVLVTVAGARGSVPREPGTRMLVTHDHLCGTIGGGGLEAHAIEQARALLADGASARILRRFPLGLAFGQCCGGVACLAFELLPATPPTWLAHLAAPQGERCVRVALANRGDAAVLLVNEYGVHGSLGAAALDERATARARALLVAGARAPVLEELDGGADPGVGQAPVLLYEPPGPAPLPLALFGAGHVGCALVQVLAAYPSRIRWFDGRPGVFPAPLPTGADACATADPDAAVAMLPAGTLCLVMTHDHALDLELVARLLVRAELPFVGMIGSRSKRANFERKLRQRGLPPAAIARLVSPIGIDGVNDKHPAAIAIAVAAQLLQVHTAARAAMPDHGATRRATVGAAT